MDHKATIKELKDYLAQFVDERQWQQFHSPKNLAMGMAVELGELMEHFLWIDEKESRQIVDDPQEMALIREEMADVFCYLLNLAQVLKVDLSEAFYEKMKRNNEKYPADKFRGKYKL